MASNDNSYGSDGAIIFGVFSFVTACTFWISCLWCRQKWAKFKEQQNWSIGGTHSVAPSGSEISSFPPLTTNELKQMSLVPSALLDDIIFEPLPEIRSRNLQAVAQNIRPACFTDMSRKISIENWFGEHQSNFPRNQLKYLREVGSAWYGQAVEGEAYNMIVGQEKTRAVVKILRVDASISEYMQFLHEVRPLCELHHPHLLSLFGRCLEVQPFLLIMEHCKIDLKSYLIQLRKSPEVLLKDGAFLLLAYNIASALHHMHENGYVHNDFAAHSCYIDAECNVKVGDYGTALFMHKSDYYCLGDIAFPLRWCAPESLHCTESMIEAKRITQKANVWSFGVLLWELLEFGKLPYIDFTDDEVVQKVVIESSLKLEQPKTPCIHKDMIFKVMQLCWCPVNHRPSLQKIVALLNYLYNNRNCVSETLVFDSKWDALQPVFKDNSTLYNISSSLKFESDFHSQNDQEQSHDCDSIMSSEFTPSHLGYMCARV